MHHRRQAKLCVRSTHVHVCIRAHSYFQFDPRTESTRMYLKLFHCSHAARERVPPPLRALSVRMYPNIQPQWPLAPLSLPRVNAHDQPLLHVLLWAGVPSNSSRDKRRFPHNLCSGAAGRKYLLQGAGGRNIGTRPLNENAHVEVDDTPLRFSSFHVSSRRHIQLASTTYGTAVAELPIRRCRSPVRSWRTKHTPPGS